MAWRNHRAFSLVVLATICFGPSLAQAQQGNGVVIDGGVLKTRVVHDPSGQLTRARLMAARSALDPNMARASKERYVSLTKLEAAAAAHLETGQGLPYEMRYLAGLTRIRRVFLYPETGEIVVAGPAEGFMENIAGRVVGIHTGRATLELQDLVAALRSFPPSGEKTQALVVSIDPTEEGLQRMQQYLMRISGSGQVHAARIAAGLKENLGLQNVRIEGVSPKTHFAQVLVEADYRMKLIGIGLENPPARIKSYVAYASPSAVARNALQRWYFTPNYDCVRLSDDELAMELQGDGVQLIGEDQLVQAHGGRVASGQVDRASQMFVQSFTRQYPELAKHEPVYAQLRNLIDMAIVAAFLQQYDYYAQAGWSMSTFGEEEKFAIETYDVPEQVETAVNAIWKGNTLMTPVGGGVEIQPLLALSSENLSVDEDGELKEARADVETPAQDAQIWWWD